MHVICTLRAYSLTTGKKNSDRRIVEQRHVRLSNNRPVMSCDVTRVLRSTDQRVSTRPIHDRDRVLVGHELTPINSLPFAHTSHHYCPLDGYMMSSECQEDNQT
uniref:Uncharacterized protein n=1 Tax=Erpetoichthys calabaricus TaxID=27687 RepID=A0A8C4T7C3_ERPCA